LEKLLENDMENFIYFFVHVEIRIQEGR
jgi:hypothetical protein